MRKQEKLLLKARAIELRQSDRLSVKSVSKRLKVSLSTVAGWLRPYPLTKEEIKRVMSDNGKKYGSRNLRSMGGAHCKERRVVVPSKYIDFVPKNLSTNQKGHIAEAAVIFRLALLGADAYTRTSDGQKYDVVVVLNTGRIIRIQVKLMKAGFYGMPQAHVRCSAGRNKFRKIVASDYDVFVGYDLVEDKAYVYPVSEIIGKSMISADLKHEENWKILGCISSVQPEQPPV